MKGILKWPLIIAAIVTVSRVIVERAGAPDSVSFYVSTVFLHLIIMPLYFAIRIAQSTETRPYVQQIKLTLLFVVAARAMILPAYWLGYIFQWEQGRFVGMIGASWFRGFIAEPLITAAVWIVSSTIVGGLTGCAVIAVWRLMRKPLAQST